MTESQTQLQNALTTTFLANLAFLSEYDNELYHRIDELSRMIENGTYKEKYALEFIMENGDFDIYDIVNDKYLYDKQISKFNNKAVSQINFDTKGSFSIIDSLYVSDKEFLDNKKIFENNLFLEKAFLQKQDLNEYREVLKEDLSNYRNKKIKNIDKFIFIGTLLGRHIPRILKKTNAKNFLVCERNLEIFRLSLFVIDYSVLARDDKRVVFSIMDEKFSFNQQGSNFLRNNYHQNSVIKYFTTDFNVSEYFDEIMDSVVSEQTEGFNYYMMLDNVARLSLSRIKDYRVIQRELAREYKLSIQNKPVLYVGAGPSLSDNIQWISENKNKFIIVTMGAACKKLISNGIIPDIVGTLDPQYQVLNDYQFTDEVVEKLKNSIILASANTDQRILDKFNQKLLFLYEIITTINHKNSTENGYSIGEILGTMLITLGVKELYLIGIDLAVNQESGETHISGYETSDKFDLKEVKSSLQKDNFSIREDLIKVKGNFKEKVYTTRLFNMSLNTFSLSCEFLKPEEHKIYNLSKNGAYIQNTISLDVDAFNPKEFSILDKKIVLKDLIDDFLLLTNNYLTDEVFDNLQIEKDYLLQIKKDFIDINIEYKFLDEFIKDFLKLEKKLLTPDIETIFTPFIFSYYFRAIFPYTYYCLNDKNLKNEYKKINEVNTIMKRQLSKLVDRYISYLDLVLIKK